MPNRAMLLAVLLCFTAIVGGCGGHSSQEDLEKAKALLQSKDRKAAIVLLKAALQRRGDVAGTRLLLGKALFDEGDAAAAVVELQKARELGEPDEHVLPTLARAMSQSGQASKVLDQFSNVRLADPVAQAKLLVSLALASSSNGQMEQFQRLLKAALESNPKDLDARVLQARTRAVAGEYDAAFEEIDQVLKEDESNVPAWYTKGMLLRLVRNDMTGALAAQRRALALEPRSVPAHDEIMSVLFLLRDVKGMREHLKIMRAAMPTAFVTAVYEAQVEFLENNLRRSKEIIQQLMKTNIVDLRVTLLAAQIEMKIGSLVQAETYLSKILQLVPDSRPARYFLGAVHLRSGQADKALATLQPLLEKDPNDADALGLAAEAQLLLGDLAKAQDYFERASRINPKDAKLRTAAALSTIARGKVDEGVAQLQATSSTSADTYADLALVSVQLRRKNIPAALAASDALLAKSKDTALPYFVRGDILVRKGDIAAARQSFEKAVEIDGSYYPAVSALVGMDKAEGNFGAAKSRLEKLISKGATNFRAYVALADLKRRLGDSPESIIAVLRDGVDKVPSEPMARVPLADYLLSLRKSREAAEVVQAGLAIFPDHPELLDTLGLAQAASGEFQQATTTFRKLATLQPASSKPHLRLAEVYAAKKDYQAARRSISRASELNPALLTIDVRAMDMALADGDYKGALALAKRVQVKKPKEALGWLMEGEAHGRTQHWPEAFSAFKTASTMQASSRSAQGMHGALLAMGRAAEAARLAGTWLTAHPDDIGFRRHLGVAAVRAGDWPQAEAIYLEVLKGKPDDSDANNNTAWAMLKQGKPASLTYAERANALQPRRADFLDTLANAQLVNGKADAAIKSAEDALSVDPTFNDARLTLAKALLKAGNTSRASKELDTLAYLGDKFPGQLEVQQLVSGLRRSPK